MQCNGNYFSAKTNQLCYLWGDPIQASPNSLYVNTGTLLGAHSDLWICTHTNPRPLANSLLAMDHMGCYACMNTIVPPLLSFPFLVQSKVLHPLLVSTLCSYMNLSCGHTIFVLNCTIFQFTVESYRVAMFSMLPNYFIPPSPFLQIKQEWLCLCTLQLYAVMIF